LFHFTTPGDPEAIQYHGNEKPVKSKLDQMNLIQGSFAENVDI